MQYLWTIFLRTYCFTRLGKKFYVDLLHVKTLFSKTLSDKAQPVGSTYKENKKLIMLNKNPPYINDFSFKMTEKKCKILVLCTGAGAGAGVLTYFAGAGAGAGVCSPPAKLRQLLFVLQTIIVQYISEKTLVRLRKIDTHI